MEHVLRGFLVYAFLYVILRIAGKRTLSEMSNFDLLILLIISEVTQQAMVDRDHSLTAGFILITTLVGVDIALSLIKQRFTRVAKVLESQPLLLLVNGRPLLDAMDRERVDEDDILAAARQSHGLIRLDQIRYAVLERDGKISIIPQDTPQ